MSEVPLYDLSRHPYSDTASVRVRARKGRTVFNRIERPRKADVQ